jgi:hypothetical protein
MDPFFSGIQILGHDESGRGMKNSADKIEPFFFNVRLLFGNSQLKESDDSRIVIPIADNH